MQAWALLSNRTRQLTESISPIDITFKRCSHSNSHKTVFIVYPFASGLLGIFFLAFARLDRGFLSFVLAQQFPWLCHTAVFSHLSDAEDAQNHSIEFWASANHTLRDTS